MSLLEDVFLHDETEEAQDLERIIEGDEYEGARPRSDEDDDDDSVRGDDEAEEDKRRVDPHKAKQPKVVKNPRFVLNPARLTGPRGIQIIPEHFKDFKFKGKGHEKEDLDMVLKKLEHWAYRLYPKFKFEDCLKKIETLGKKRSVMVHLHKIRSDQFASEETIVQKDSSDEEVAPIDTPQEDEFDKLLQQQIDLSRMTPAPNSTKKPGFITPGSVSTPFAAPKATSSPSISEDQRERMLRYKRLAEERRLAKLKINTENVTPGQISESDDLTDLNGLNNSTINKIHHKSNFNDSSDEEVESESKVVDLTGNLVRNDVKRNNRSNVIESSDDETEMAAVINTVNADIHKSLENDKVVDLTERTVLNIMAKKQQRSNVIDESDEEEKSIDLTENTYDNSLSAVKHSESNDINSKSIKERSAFDKIVDLTENSNSAEKVNSNYSIREFNTSDTSDEECDMTSINQSITVDIHYSVRKDDNNKVNESILNVNSNVAEQNELVENNSNELLQNKNAINNKENIDANIDLVSATSKTNGVDEIMDVDFSEEY